MRFSLTFVGAKVKSTHSTQVSVSGECLTEQWLALVAITSRLVLTLSTLVIARLTDLLRGHIKKTSLWLLALATVAYTGLSLVSTGTIAPPSYVSLEASVFSLLVIGNCLARSTGPLFQVYFGSFWISDKHTIIQELLVEISFPVSEIVCGTFTVLGFSSVSLIFLLVFQVLKNSLLSLMSRFLGIDKAICL